MKMSAAAMQNTFANEITVLFNGYGILENSDLMIANCTCSLIRGKSTITIVDTRTAWDANEIISELTKYDVQPADITHVVCTHGHSDHIGCNHLFLEAKVHIVGHSVSHKDQYFLHNFLTNDYAIDDGISVTATPGHTLDSVSVVVSNSNLGECVAICGDLYENKTDVFDSSIWIEAGSESIGKQCKSRERMGKIANVIIPGHGEIFYVTADIREKLTMDVNELGSDALK